MKIILIKYFIWKEIYSCTQFKLPQSCSINPFESKSDEGSIWLLNHSHWSLHQFKRFKKFFLLFLIWEKGKVLIGMTQWHNTN